MTSILDRLKAEKAVWEENLSDRTKEDPRNEYVRGYKRADVDRIGDMIHVLTMLISQIERGEFDDIQQ